MHTYAGPPVDGAATRLGRLIEVTAATRDRAAAVAFHRAAWGLDVISESSGAVVLGAAGTDHGHLRLVAAASDPRVAHPLPWELGAHVLGVTPRDVDASRAAVAELGMRTTQVASYAFAPGAVTREYWADGPDDVIWIVPMPQAATNAALAADPARTHSEVLIVGITTDRLDEALGVFAEAGGMTVLADGLCQGPAYATLFGFPPEAGVRAAVLVSPDGGMLIELWQFVGVDHVRGPHRPVGLQRLSFEAADPAGLGRRLAAAGAAPTGAPNTFTHSGIDIELRSTG